MNNRLYRVLDADVFESYMAMEGWDSFPFLHTQINENGEFRSFMKDFEQYMIYTEKGSGCLLEAVCIYRILVDTLVIDYFEINKKIRHQGIGSAVLETLIYVTGLSKVELDAKDENAAKFWAAMGLKQSDQQHFTLG